MKKRIPRVLVIICAAIVGVGGLVGERGYAQGIPNVSHEEGHADWMDLWTRIQKIRMDEMKTSLKLEGKTMDRLAPSLIAFDTKKREIGQERLQLLRELKRLTKDKANEAPLQETLNRLEANQAALEAVKQETKMHLSAHLTPQQQAQYILFQRNFNARLRDLIQKEKR